MNQALVVLALFMIFISPASAAEVQTTTYAGSRSCRECHQRFYDLWSGSMHGLAMQPYTAELAREKLAAAAHPVRIGTQRYRADLVTGDVMEMGPAGEKRYPIAYALGGKNVFYFLTPMNKGRLQTLPIAYDIRTREWFDTALSGLRHFPGQQGAETPVGWQEWPYTFNTSCYGCHVSQLATNYDLKTDTYATSWKEPGINCETCHGGSEAHNDAMRQFPKGVTPPDTTDYKILRTKTFSPAQHNDACTSCHSKAMPLTAGYKTPEPFFDHFDLVALEDRDYYPDGRDLGENYTQTSWLMSPCVKGGKLHCITCHTSSGRYRFKKEKFNNACLPCHEERVRNVAAHSRHPAESEASRCIACHMPTTQFARMQRTDHSMRPPTPATTIAYQSPNACNGCHADRDALWADRHVRSWRQRDYQAPILKRAALIDAARKQDWTKLPDMLAYINDSKSDELFTASLIRLIPPTLNPKIRESLLAAATGPSPLVRGAAIQALGLLPSVESLQALVVATGDEFRVVRVRAAAGIAAFPKLTVPPAYQAQLKKANDEYLASITARPDQWTSHYNMGNYLLGRGELQSAVASYQTALKLDPHATMAMVNTSIAHARMGENDKAEKALQMALKQAPDSAVANFNMGLLKAGKNELNAAETYLKNALTADPQMAQAAYNLCIITAKDRIGEAVTWCRKASDLRPLEPKYAYTLAFYLNQMGDKDAAVKILRGILEKNPQRKDAELLLGELSN
jgi:tetratricopeptide (TPR) repeat protein